MVNDVLNWFEYGINFLNYGNPIQELGMAIATSEEVKTLFLEMIQEMDLDLQISELKKKKMNGLRFIPNILLMTMNLN